MVGNGRPVKNPNSWHMRRKANGGKPLGREHLQAKHGTRTRYKKYGCRCGTCVSAYHEYNRYYGAKQHAQRKEKVSQLKSVPCADCGIQYPPCVMDFDHLPGEEKAFNVGRHVTRAWADVIAEISKCEVVCANCHRLRTEARRHEKC